MGIVFKQSLKNTITIYSAFVFGGINALFLYTSFLNDTYYGLVVFLLSTSNLLMPFTAFGVQYTILKFYSAYTSKVEKDRFLSTVILAPLFIAIPMGFVGSLFYESISNYLSLKNPIVKNYTFVIYLVAIATAYFEVFYAWAKVQMQSVYGNILKELFPRISAMFFLFLVFLEVISASGFIYYLTAAYFLRTFLMLLYALRLYTPKFSIGIPNNFKEILRYSGYIILAGAAGSILIDIDKFMIPQKEAIAYAAYYAVAVYIGSVVETPGRAMSQIVQPLIAKALNENQLDEVQSLYKKSAINLLVISGLVFLLINLNINQMYLLLPEKYSGGVWVVLFISLAKLYQMFLGANGAIISNSKYYRILLPYGISMAVSVYFLNDYLIDLMSIEGAALSTFIVVYTFNTFKLAYVKNKFNMTPFTNKTGVLVLILILSYFSFCFWDFNFHPILNILFKSILIVAVYFFSVWKLKISDEIISIVTKMIK